MSATRATVANWLDVIQAEYREIPGLHLTKPQVQRMWGLDRETCDGVIDALVSLDFLRRTTRDGYVLASLER
jgi:putative heme degradation protein